jgi:hypothetical protein
MEIWRFRSFGHFLLSISFCWNPVLYKWRLQGFYDLRKCIEFEVEFPHAPEGQPGWNCTVVGLMKSYKRVCGFFPLFYF